MSSTHASDVTDGLAYKTAEVVGWRSATHLGRLGPRKAHRELVDFFIRGSERHEVAAGERGVSLGNEKGRRRGRNAALSTTQSPLRRQRLSTVH